MPPSHIDLPALPRGMDLLEKHKAGLLATFIEAYWKARGFRGIKAERFPVDPLLPDGAWGVRSNCVNGYPPR